MDRRGLMSGTALSNPDQPAPPPASGAAPVPGGEADGNPNVSPQEQEAYDRFVGNGIKLIFAEKTRASIIKRIQSSQSPVEGLAATTVMVVTRLRDSLEADVGGQIPADVLMHGGMELLANIADLAEAANIHTFTEEEKEAAIYKALDGYATQEQAAGRLDEQSIGGDFQQMMEADQAGRIEEVLPGITEKASDFERRRPAAPQGERGV